MRAVNRFPAGSFDIAVDVGAAQGLFTWILSRKAQSVYAFEPGTTLGRLMRWSTPFSNVRFQQQAVGESPGTVSLFTPATGLFGATVSVLSPVANGEKVSINAVQQVPLDEALAAPLAKGRSVDFIKIDVEGYELNVLKGSAKLIGQCHPVVLCEIERRHNPHTSAVFHELRGLGYRCHVIKDGKLFAFDETDVVGVQQDRSNASLPYLNNFLFQHPKSRVDVAALLGAALAHLADRR